MMMSEREERMQVAQLCEAASRYGEMVEVMSELVTALPRTQKLNAEERKLLSIAFKNEVAFRRKSLKSLRHISVLRDLSIETKQIVAEYKRRIEQEMRELCVELIQMLDTKLLPGVNEPESDIFYHKMKGDYCRYLCEVEDDQVKVTDYLAEIKEHYQVATDYAVRSLAATHPLRIGLAMNYSVFLHEMVDDVTLARDHAKRFYDEALDEMENVREVDTDRYNECAFLLKLMHENIKAWTLESDMDAVFPSTDGSQKPPQTMSKDF
ncbi:14-3-3 protein zeta-like [Mya arenaria]|uniref:14-3-3 protein zeta-like n=1 Tax=Mya arenaria TaxID=6604 RepID=UPI0022DFB428|nr:14-3-3 protein zeta-like [Mya arenaria]